MSLRMAKYFGAALLAALFVTACGGGGGSGAPAAVSYTGVTTQATLTDTNAEKVALRAYSGGEMGTNLNLAGVVTAPSADGSTTAIQSRPQMLANALAAAMHQVNVTAAPAPAPAMPAGTTMAPTTVPDGQGGSYSYTISYDQATGSFSGSFTFSGYHSGDAVMSGGVTFSGVIDLNNPNASNPFTKFTMSFIALTANSSAGSFVSSGSLTWDYSQTDPTASLTLVLRDNATNKTYMVENYKITEAAGSTNISGKYYDYDHGYVTITTVTPLTVASGAHPLAGSLRFTASNGSALLTFVDATHYTVDISYTGGATLHILRSW